MYFCVAAANQVANTAEKRGRTQSTTPSTTVQKLTKKVAQTEEEVYQELAAMNEETSKMLELWQLITYTDSKVKTHGLP